MVNNMLKYIKKTIDKKALLIAFIHFIISFFTDRLIFNYNLLDFSNTVTIIKAIIALGAKLAFLILLIFIWQTVFYVVKELKQGNSNIKDYIKYTGIYLGIMLVFFICLFPGLWRMDEFGILKNATFILPHFWQGYLTSVFYIFALMLVPNPSGVIFIQLIVISFITGYIVYKISRYVKNPNAAYFMYIPFLLFPVIDSNFYPIRMSIYAFLEVLFAFELFSIKYEKREIKSRNIYLLALLAGILVCWRTESIYYIILAPVTFIILFYKETDRGCKLKFLISVVLISGVLTGIQTIGNSIDSGKEYDITSVILPITPLVNEAYENSDYELIEQIENVLDTKILTEGYRLGKTGISMYWSEDKLVKENYTDEQYKEFKAAYVKLILKYPFVFLKERLDTFTGSTGILNNTEDMFIEDTAEYYISFRENYNYKGEHKLRRNLIKLLEFTDNENIHNIVYSALIPSLIMILICLVLLFKKKWGYFFICGEICAKIPLIFLTAPSRLFMYYYSIYLAAAVLVAMLFIRYVDKKG